MMITCKNNLNQHRNDTTTYMKNKQQCSEDVCFILQYLLRRPKLDEYSAQGQACVCIKPPLQDIQWHGRPNWYRDVRNSGGGVKKRSGSTYCGHAETQKQNLTASADAASPCMHSTASAACWRCEISTVTLSTNITCSCYSQNKITEANWRKQLQMSLIKIIIHGDIKENFNFQLINIFFF